MLLRMFLYLHIILFIRKLTDKLLELPETGAFTGPSRYLCNQLFLFYIMASFRSICGDFMFSVNLC